MRNYLFVDGSNLYAGQYELLGPKRFLDFERLIKAIEKKIKIKFNKVFFYTSYSPQSKKPSKKEKAYLKNEACFYKNVKKISNLNFFNGYRSKTSGKEKEVDVKLAVDIVDLAHKNKYDVLYLFSGDADFNHALAIARGLKKRVYVLALENRIPNRFTYLYQTFILKIDSKRKIKKDHKQKIKIIELGNNLIKRI